MRLQSTSKLLSTKSSSPRNNTLDKPDGCELTQWAQKQKKMDNSLARLEAKADHDISSEWSSITDSQDDDERCNHKKIRRNLIVVLPIEVAILIAQHQQQE